MESFDPESDKSQLNIKVEDITEVSKELEQKYRPNVYVIGESLIREKDRIYGGLYYRVLKDSNNHYVIQYLHVWNKQRFALDIISYYLPIIFLIIFGMYINTDIIFNSTIGSFENLLTKNDRIILIGTITGIYLLIGLYYLVKFFIKRIFSVRIYFALYGIIFFIASIINLEFVKTPPNTDISNLLGFFDVTFYWYWYSILVLFLLIILFPLYKLIAKRIKLLRELSGYHEMDYAPIFVYLDKDPNTGAYMPIDILYDKLHYCVDIKNPGDNQSFIINDSWHSMELWPNRSIKRYRIAHELSMLLFPLIVLFWAFSIVVKFDFWIIIQSLPIPDPIGSILQRILYPLIMILLLYFIFVLRPKELTDENKLYPLTSEKIQQFWKYKNYEAQLKIDKKLVNPFDYLNAIPTMNWMSFYNDDNKKAKEAEILCYTAKLQFLFKDKTKVATKLSNYAQKYKERNITTFSNQLYTKSADLYDEVLNTDPENISVLISQMEVFQALGKENEAQKNSEKIEQLKMKKEKQG